MYTKRVSFAGKQIIMSTQFHGLRTTVYMVSDLEAAAKWYTGILGTDPYFNTPYYVGFNVGGFELGLHPEAEGTVKGNSVLTYWGVDDVDEMMKKLTSAGAVEYEKPNEVGEGIVVASVKDPWGNVLGIIRNPHFNS